MIDNHTNRTRLRRAAARQGLKITKSSRRDPKAPDYGKWWVLDLESGRVIFGGKNGASITAVATLLDVEDTDQ